MPQERGTPVPSLPSAALLLYLMGVDSNGSVRITQARVSEGLDFVQIAVDAATALASTIDHETRISTLEDSQGGGQIGFASKAAMDADLDHPAGTIARVGESEADESLRGFYLKSGASGAGSWVFDGELGAPQSLVDQLSLSIAWEEESRRPLLYGAHSGAWAVPVGVNNADGTYAIFGGINDVFRVDLEMERGDLVLRRYSDEYLDAVIDQDDRIAGGIRKPRLGPKWVGGIAGGVAYVSNGTVQFPIAGELGTAIGITIENNVARVLGGAGPYTDRVVRLYGETSADPSVTNLRQVGRTGQSEDQGHGDSAPIHDTPIEPGFVLMFNSGLRKRGTDHSLPWANIAALPDESERLVDAYEIDSGLSGETGLAFLGKLMYDDGAATDAILLFTEAIGSTASATNTAGVYLANLLEGFGRGYEIAMLNGWTYEAAFVRYDGGQADAAGATSKATMTTILTTFQAAMTTGVQARTDHTGELVVVSHQPANGGNEGPAAAILQLARDEPTKFICPGPGYIYEHIASESPAKIHYTALGHALAEAYANRAARDGDLPLHVTSAVRTAAEIVLSFGGREGVLVLDTSIVSDPGNFGVEYEDTGGNSVTISSVALFNSDTQVKVTLSTTPTGTDQKIKIACGGSATDAGPTTGPRACIRDSAADTETIDGDVYTLRRYVCRDIINVT